ncbi:hypothetical protein [Gordonia rhizosphera]|uniref:Transporter n=1 Tax=Gordonia rhizosphera NBRC 16068 TaxID=1108045 RepID=K6WCT8_9ACTN|nr:hypothetical protein [Gordonia rhizosphera]GAB91556.1 hypothetical protein GORHZ_136_00190 [Gordonia rhizosphera NBRC 16068]
MQPIDLTAAHWVYLAGVIVIIATMVMRKNIVVPAVIATFLTAFAFSDSIVTAIASIFNASLVAAKELFNIFLIIALVTAMLGGLRQMGADRLMIAPFRKVMRSPTSSFVVLAVVTYVISLFFWPTPAVPLVGAVLIPVAIRAGLSPMSVGMVIAIAGQGMALSSDYVMKVAPGISAKAAGIDPDAVADKSLILSLIVGGVAFLITFVMQRRTWRAPSAELLTEWENEADRHVATVEAADSEALENSGTEASSGGTGSGSIVRSSGGSDGGVTTTGGSTGTAVLDHGTPSDDGGNGIERTRKAMIFAVLVPLVYFVFIAYLVLGKIGVVPELKGGDAAAMVGGIAALLLFAVCAADEPSKFLETTAEHLVDGLVFAFKAMGIVLPIAGFFLIGSADYAGQILGLSDDATAPAFLYDLVTAGEAHLPNIPIFTSFGVLLVGLVAGLEGSGFSGLPLTGALAGALAPGSGIDPATLAAIGQMGNIWSGGGTLVAWSSLVAVAGFARVPVISLARKCFLPVISGLIISTVIATYLL